MVDDKVHRKLLLPLIVITILSIGVLGASVLKGQSAAAPEDDSYFIHKYPNPADRNACLVEFRKVGQVENRTTNIPCPS